MSEIDHNIVEVEFMTDHVGQKVFSLRYGLGEIMDFRKNNIKFPVCVKFNQDVVLFTKGGREDVSDKRRSLFIGHNVKITVVEGELPEKLICPVCGVEHSIYEGAASMFFFADFKKCIESSTVNICPFGYTWFKSEEHAIEAMKNLIKAFGGGNY